MDRFLSPKCWMRRGVFGVPRPERPAPVGKDLVVRMPLVVEQGPAGHQDAGEVLSSEGGKSGKRVGTDLQFIPMWI